MSEIHDIKIKQREIPKDTSYIVPITNNSFEDWTDGVIGTGWLSTTKLVSSFNGADGAVAYTDPIQGAYTFEGGSELDSGVSGLLGTACLKLNGSTGYTTLPDSADWNFGTVDFTIKARVRFNAIGSYQDIMGQGTDANNILEFGLTNGNQIRFIATTGASSWAASYVSTDASIVADTWYHIAVVRNGASFKIYIDGTALTLTEIEAIGTMPNYTSTFTVGAYNDGAAHGNYFNGWIEEVIIKKGIAEHTANFTPYPGEYTQDNWNAPDNWVVSSFAGGSVARETTIKKFGNYSMKMARGGVDGDYRQNAALDKGIDYWKGRTVTYGCWVYATVADRCKLVLTDGIEQTTSSFHTGDSTWQWITLTHTVNDSATGVICTLAIVDGDTSGYFDGAKVIDVDRYNALLNSPTLKWFDIGFTNGDFDLEDTFYSAINISLFADSRADESEVPEPSRRRGYWGDFLLFPDDPNIKTGSKLWLAQGRRTDYELGKAIDYCKKALQWIIDKGKAKDIKVSGSFSTNGIIIDIQIIIEDSLIQNFSFKLWQNGVTEIIEGE